MRGGLLEDRWLRATFVALAAVSLIPIWIVRYHPITDLGNHLAAVAVMRHLHDPAWHFAPYYKLSLGIVPYWAHYGALYLLSLVFSLDLANRLLLSAWVVGLPLATGALARQLGRSPWLCLFAFPFVWNYSFLWGFLSCVGGFALAFLGLAWFDRFCERPRLGLGVACGLFGGALYLCHLLPWGFFVGAAALVALLHEPRRPRALAARAGAWALAAGLGGAFFLSGHLLHVARVRRHVTFRFYPVLEQLQSAHLFLFGQCAAHWDWIFAGGLVVGWLGLKLTQPRQTLRLRDFRMEACFLVAAGAYLLLPRSVLQPRYWWGINVRYAPFAALLLLLCVRGEIAGRRRLWLAPVALAGVLFACDVAVHFRRATAFVDGYDALARIPEPGARVLWVVTPPWRDPTYGFDHARALPHLYQAYRGGYQPWNFDEGFPLKYKVRFPGGDWSRPGFRWDVAKYYDYVMFFQGDPERQMRGGGLARLVGRAGRWSLWKLPGPRVDTPPAPP